MISRNHQVILFNIKKTDHKKNESDSKLVSVENNNCLSCCFCNKLAQQKNTTMNLANNTILITGGASGIGLALAERFLAAGSKVIVCGRSAEKLHEAKSKFPQLITKQCDVSTPAERIELLNWVKTAIPNLNILINNAGIQRRVNFKENQDDWSEFQKEIAINLEAPIHLSHLFIPHLLQQRDPYIVNVGSGLAFVPAAFVPVYSATKAALHSFTLSLRHQLSSTTIKVVEIIPPAVDTDLGGPGLHTFGVPLQDFADAIMLGMSAGKKEVAYGTAESRLQVGKGELDEIFKMMNK